MKLQLVHDTSFLPLEYTVYSAATRETWVWCGYAVSCVLANAFLIIVKRGDVSFRMDIACHFRCLVLISFPAFPRDISTDLEKDDPAV